MNIKHHNVDHLPKGGPYSHIVEAGGFLYISGTLPFDSAVNRIIIDDFTRATTVVLANIKEALAQTGCGMEHVVKITVYLTDMAHFSAMNEIYKSFFPLNPPARTCIGVNSLPAGAAIEIDAIAVKPR